MLYTAYFRIFEAKIIVRDAKNSSSILRLETRWSTWMFDNYVKFSILTMSRKYGHKTEVYRVRYGMVYVV